MRILSQDKMLDVDYSKVYLSVEESADGEIGSIFVSDTFKKDVGYEILGQYNSKERALEVMDKIRRRNVFAEVFKKASAEERDYMVATKAEESNVTEAEALIATEYYYMPAE